METWRYWSDGHTGFEALEAFLKNNSGLPGPRANLKLAEQFAEEVMGRIPDEPAWKLLLEWSRRSEAEAPANDPGEFLPFCAIQAIGACYTALTAERKKEALPVLKEAMSDPRWRVREAVAIALQRIGEQDFGLLEEWFEDWLEQANALERRAFVATLAHPPLLGNREHALFGLKLAERILQDWAMGLPISEKEEARVLNKGLEYTLSVLVEKEPEEGFAVMRRVAAMNDKQMDRILSANLGKARLSKKYPKEVAEVRLLLQEN